MLRCHISDEGIESKRVGKGFCRLEEVLIAIVFHLITKPIVKASHEDIVDWCVHLTLYYIFARFSICAIERRCCYKNEIGITPLPANYIDCIQEKKNKTSRTVPSSQHNLHLESSSYLAARKKSSRCIDTTFDTPTMTSTSAEEAFGMAFLDAFEAGQLV
jgi:hypothetical protein